MASEHIIKSYDEELDRLKQIIVEMGGMAESQLAAAIEAVVKRDSELAARSSRPMTRPINWSAISTIWRSGSSHCASRWRAICARSSPR